MTVTYLLTCLLTEGKGETRGPSSLDLSAEVEDNLRGTGGTPTLGHPRVNNTQLTHSSSLPESGSSGWERGLESGTATSVGTGTVSTHSGTFGSPTTATPGPLCTRPSVKVSTVYGQASRTTLYPDSCGEPPPVGEGTGVQRREEVPTRCLRVDIIRSTFR